MGMFLNYHNIADNYTPNNLICSFPVGKSYTKLDPLKTSKPYEEYDFEGNLIGYFWHYGETLNLEFNIDGEITVESDSIIFSNKGECPNISTQGKVNQRAYNIVDFRSWTCTSVIDDTYYVWEEDAEFEYDESSSTSIYVPAQYYLEDKFVQITIYNFRLEPLYQESTKAGTSVVFEIDPELSRKMVKGIYYCSLLVYNDDTQKTIFSPKDCTLLVK